MRIRAKEWRRSSFEQRRRFIYRFSHHPTVLGLFFSILGQFTGTGYGTDTDGNFIKLLFPENALVGKNVLLLCNGLVLLKTYLLTVIMLAHRPRVSMSPYLFHPLAIVAVVTSKPLATTHAELNNNCKLKLQIHPTRLFYKTHCLDDQQSHQALTLNSFPANLRDCLRQLSIMRNQQ